MVAIAIFSLIGVGCYNVLHGLLTARSSIDKKSEYIREISIALNTIDSDMTQISSRKVVDSNDKIAAAVVMKKNEKTLEFSRYGSRNPKIDRRAEVIRVQYALVSGSDLDEIGIDMADDPEKSSSENDSDGYLVRKVYPVLDGASDDADVSAKIIMSGVTDFEVEFYNEKSKWVKEWPPEPTQTAGSNQGVPYAVKIKMITQQFGTLERVVSITDLHKPEG